MADHKFSPDMGQIHPGRTSEVSHAVISWPAIFSGFFTTIIIYTGLICLGIALGGHSLYDVVQKQDELKNLGIGAALWTIASAVIALYAGGHVSGRVAGLISTRVGRIQGMVITSMFFVLMFTQAGMLLGMLGGGLSSVAASAGSAISSSVGQEIIEDGIGDLQIRGDIAELTKGVSTRLLRGDEQSALTFLAHRTGMSVEDAQARLATFKAKFLAAAEQAGLTAARSLRTVGWTLFAAILLGCVAGMMGGAFAANYNLREPVSAADHKALRESHAH